MKRLFFLGIAILFNLKINAQPVQSLSSSEILWELYNLQNTGAALYFAAHPDDENTRLISYLANERHIRTAYLALTRGDGGQNLIGAEKGPLLGMIRTQELLAARRTDHGRQFFSRAYDFGYSKSPEETFHFWNKDSVLADAVWVIRSFRPDVIICRFPATGEGGHGHHTASAIIAEEAFEAAADPKRFPEQLKYTTTWQAKRIVWNTYKFGSRNTTSPDQLKIDVGGYNPLLGKYNGEIAAESRSMHKSQGFGSGKNRGTQYEYFKHIKGTEAKNDLMDGVDMTWNRYPETQLLNNIVKELIADYRYSYDKNYLQKLLNAYQAFQKINTENQFVQKLIAEKTITLKRIILAYSGIWLDAVAEKEIVAPGEHLNVDITVVSSQEPIQVNSATTLQTKKEIQKTIAKNEAETFQQQIQLPADFAYNSPYWLKTFPQKGLFQVHDILKNTLPENPAPVQTIMNIRVLETNLSVSIPVRYKKVDPVKGESYQPLEIVPSIAMNIPYNHLVFANTKPKQLSLILQSNTEDAINGTIDYKAPKGWKVAIQKPQFSLNGIGHQQTIIVDITPAANAENGELSFSATTNKGKFNQSITTIQYDHIPKQTLVQPAVATLTYENITIPQVKVGYIPGAGDEVAELLKEIGLDITILSDEELTFSNLQHYDAIITGIRAYNTNTILQNLHDKMMAYVAKGGNLIVQYNTNSRAGPLTSKIGPYPFTVTRNRVTDETAPVTILQPNHPAFTTPNKISQKDFEGWIQERGIYFADDIDSKYQKLLRMNDPNEEAQEGSLIVADYGKGNFVYTGLVFFRELPAGVPGAYKLLLNLVGLPKNK